MKQIFRIIPSIFLCLFVPLFFSCGSGDGESYEDLVLKATGNTWYEYNNSSDQAQKPTYANTDNNNSESLANIYVKYNTANEQLVFAAVGTSHYAQSGKSLSSEKWVTMITVETLASGKLKKTSSDPTSGKAEITSFEAWGNYTIEYLVWILFQ